LDNKVCDITDAPCNQEVKLYPNFKILSQKKNETLNKPVPKMMTHTTYYLTNPFFYLIIHAAELHIWKSK